jgi:hypothetical protein
MERRWYASAFGSEPQWAEAVEMAHELEKVGMLEKADAAEMLEKADAEMTEKADVWWRRVTRWRPWRPIWKHDVFL